MLGELWNLTLLWHLLIFMFTNDTKIWKYVDFGWPCKCVPALLKYI